MLLNDIIERSPYSNNLNNYNNIFNENNPPNLPTTSADPVELQDPFTVNFEDLETSIKTNFISSWTSTGFNETYLGELDNSLAIADGNVYSVDNLLLYNTLFQIDYDPSETYQRYIELKSTPLWFENATTHGFVKSIDESTGDVSGYDRYLTDNLMALVLLIENLGSELNIISYNDVIYGDNDADADLSDLFWLINSTEFWDVEDRAFYDYNSTTETYKYYSKSNFYAIICNFLIHRYKGNINNDGITDRAYTLAKQAMNSFINNMWDNQYYGFNYKAIDGLDLGSDPYSEWKYLDVNALGILALLDYWVEC
ncbi:MAG: hypothetical protein ACFFAO_15990, partial [Candidatus Hermodarchaeota archaeon]